SMEMKSHHAVAAAINQHRADWGVTIEPVAKLYGLSFIPIRMEEYDFAVPVSKSGRPEIIAFQNYLKSSDFQMQLQKMGFILRPETGQWAK
ncbi:MAG: substrate-binding domain-containing protein, partial [Isosphaeraceae bacterium]